MQRSIILLATKLSKQWRSPNRPITRYLTNSLRNIINWHRNSSSSQKHEGMICIWDSSTSHISFDFIWLLFEFSHEAQSRGYDGFTLVLYFPSEPKAGSFLDYRKWVNDEEAKRRIDKIIQPLAKMHEFVRNIVTIYGKDQMKEYLQSRTEEIYPNNFSISYSPTLPYYQKVYSVLRKYVVHDERFKFFEASKPKSLQEIEQDFPDHAEVLAEAYIVLTLRDYGFDPMRDTSQSDVSKADSLAKLLGVKLYIVPDNIEKLSIYDLPEDSYVIHSARFNLYARAILYANSLVNIFRPAGPAGLSSFISTTKTILVGLGSGGASGNFEYYKKHQNWKPYEQPMLQLRTYILWLEDRDDYSADDLLHGYNSI